MMITEQALNKMQIAYILGRMNHLPLGGVAMHDFREFRGDIDLTLFEKCLENMVVRHGALRTIIDQSHFSQYQAEHARLNMTVIDYSDYSRREAIEQIDDLRMQVSHYKHDLNTSPWGVWFLKINKEQPIDFNTVLFFSFDGLILDGYSISSLINEIICCYKQLQSNNTCLADKPSNKGGKDIDFFLNKEDDKTYWLDKITLLKPNHFPWRIEIESIPYSRYQRCGLEIPRDKWDRITEYSKKSGVFPNTLINTIILRALCKLTDSVECYVGLAVSFSLYKNELSNNSTVIPLRYEEHKLSLLDAAKDIQSETMEGLFHISYSGIEIARNLCSQFKTSLPFPIVLTNALSWPVEPDYSDFYYVSGLTQTPQIGLDIRIYLSSQMTLLIDVDFAKEAVSEDIVNKFLSLIKHQIAEVDAQTLPVI